MMKIAAELGLVALRSRRGVTSLEYGIFAALLIGVITGVTTVFGQGLTSAFSNLAGALESAF